MSRIALDIGGANLKAAQLLADGQLRAASKNFAVWREPVALSEKLAELVASMGEFNELAVTMSAEMCDCFIARRQGVKHVLQAVKELAGSARVGVWLTDGRFATLDEARRLYSKAAAANWHALATYLAETLPSCEALMIDTGSSTTDIISLRSGEVHARGLTDAQRLASGELLYIGISRTPVMALGPEVNVAGQTYSVMNELFATTADVYVLLGQLPEQPHCRDTADGRVLTQRHCASRLARMIGHDGLSMNIEQATELAGAFAEIVHRRLCGAIGKVAPAPQVIAVSGSGSALAAAAAKELHSDAKIMNLADTLGEQASRAACAAALLHLWDSCSHD